MLKITILAATLLLSLVACQPPSESDACEVFFSQAIGVWQQEGQQFEQWYKAPEGFAGRVFTVSGSDTLIDERLRLLREGDTWYYEAVVAGQNEGRPIRFRLARAGAQFVRFENPAHDFPQVVEYRRLSPDRIEGSISLLDAGAGRPVVFPMTRLRQE